MIGQSPWYCIAGWSRSCEGSSDQEPALLARQWVLPSWTCFAFVTNAHLHLFHAHCISHFFQLLRLFLVFQPLQTFCF